MTADPLGLKGTVIDGKYVLGDVAGEGGAAIVYRAENTVWKIPVAVKFFFALSQAPPSEQPKLFEQFIQEGRLISDLSTKCAAIVQARDFGVLRLPDRPALPYLVLEWLEGKSLDEVLVGESRARIPPRNLEATMRLCEPIAVALTLAHNKGVAHRDIKPENMLVVGDPRGPDAQIKLLDFGIAKVMQRRLEGVHQTGTMPSAFTPYYGAPEQFSRAYGETGPWSDVFALALVLLEVMRGGERAFSGDDYTELAAQSMDEASRPTPRRLKIAVSDEVEAVFARALAVQPEQRYENVHAFWTALVGAVRPGAPAWRPPGLSVPPPPPSAPAAPRPVAPRRSIVAVAAVGGVAIIAVAAVSAGVKLAREPAPGASATASSAPPKASSSSPSPIVSAAASASSAPAMICPAGSLVIGGGRFTMGVEKGMLEAASPEHVTYVDTFCLDRDEVTVAAFTACVEAGKCQRPPAGAGCRFGANGEEPINCITHEDAARFCETREMRLPTEAEWELAASKEGPNALLAAPAEWVSDYFAPYSEEQAVNPKGPPTGTLRVVRGGSTKSAPPPQLIGRVREGVAPESRSAAIGFRCAGALR